MTTRNYEGGHRSVDLAGQFDEAGGHPEFARDPCEVERVDRDAVSSKPRSAVKMGETQAVSSLPLRSLPRC